MTPRPPGANTAAEEPLRESLNRFEAAVRATGAGVAWLLAPGLPESDVRAELASIGMEPPQELITWFGWHNGLTQAHPKSGGDGILVRWFPFSLKESIADWRHQPKSMDVFDWHPTWLPIGALSAHATRLAIDCTPSQGPRARLHVAAPEDGLFNFKVMPIVDGLSTAVDWWMQALERGWIYYDSDNDMWNKDQWTDIPLAQRLTGLI